jgi:hypothetical protein
MGGRKNDPTGADTMTSQDIAKQCREEHLKVEILTNRLREWVAVVPRTNLGSWIKETQDRFEHLRAHMIKHVALEENEGYMVGVIERRPTLAPEVDRLKHEHSELAQIMDGIHKAVQDLSPEDRLLIRDCCRRIENLIHYIDHHEDDENMLVTFVFTHDIGTKD